MVTVQKLHGDGAETASLEVQKLHGTTVQKLHPGYHGEESLKDQGCSIPALDTVEGDPDRTFDEYYPEDEGEFPTPSLPDFQNRGYRPDRKVSDPPPLKPRTPVHFPGKTVYV